MLYSRNQKIEPHRAKSNIIPKIKTSLLMKLKGKKSAEFFRNIRELVHLCQSNYDLQAQNVTVETILTINVR